MGPIDLADKYPDLFKAVGEINNNEDIDVILINEKELQEIYKGDTRLFGQYDSNDNLIKMTLLSLNNSRLESVDYYFSSDKLFYVIESSDLLTKNGEAVKKESRCSRYIFQDNQIMDYERLGYKENSFDKGTREKMIIEDTLKHIGLLRDKRTEKKK